MKIYLAGGLSAAIGFGVVFGGGRGEDRLYPVAADQVSKVLDETELPMMVFGERAVNARHWRVDAATTMWALEGARHAELLRLSATAHAEGSGTRVQVDVLPPQGDAHDLVAQGLKENGVYRDLYKAALAEQVDAKLNKRDFAITNISLATARVTLAALPHLAESFHNAEVRYRQAEQDKIDRAYAAER